MGATQGGPAKRAASHRALHADAIVSTCRPPPAGYAHPTGQYGRGLSTRDCIARKARASDCDGSPVCPPGYKIAEKVRRGASKTRQGRGTRTIYKSMPL